MGRRYCKVNCKPRREKSKIRKKIIYNNHGNQNIKGNCEDLALGNNVIEIIRATNQAITDQLKPNICFGKNTKT